jgi:hypothetical protein
MGHLGSFGVTAISPQDPACNPASVADANATPDGGLYARHERPSISSGALRIRHDESAARRCHGADSRANPVKIFSPRTDFSSTRAALSS